MVAPEQIFGVALDQLEIGALLEALAERGTESLYLEVKGGTEPMKSEVARQVGGFANSHDGGFLVLGIDEPSRSGESWTAAGWQFRDEPVLWVSNVVRSRIRPIPRFHPQQIPVGDGRFVVVVQVEPSRVDPCVVNGTVFERVPGATVVVKDPQRLAELFRRGDAARSAAQDFARRAAEVTDEWFRQPDTFQPPIPDLCVAFSLGIAATEVADDVSSRLFVRQFDDELRATARKASAGIFENPLHSHFRQSGILVPFSGVVTGERRGVIAAYWDGSVAATMALPEITSSSAETLFSAHVKPMVGLVMPALQRLGDGSIFLTLDIRSAPIRALTNEPVVRIERGPIESDALESNFKSMERELLRSTGLHAYEPDGDSERVTI